MLGFCHIFIYVYVISFLNWFINYVLVVFFLIWWGFLIASIALKYATVIHSRVELILMYLMQNIGNIGARKSLFLWAIWAEY